eukprot:TRINITY_DN92950_c0_g1_i1.p1 TRINITY_DN92950_c0_g1~~TRINITY_DN92950_c0_g1_i1.p1  ORF type:complete len:535 (-),score=118.84 TRINITY_DN92950_c0_g1_i1:309-1913(-)
MDYSTSLLDRLQGRGISVPAVSNAKGAAPGGAQAPGRPASRSSTSGGGALLAMSLAAATAAPGVGDARAAEQGVQKAAVATAVAAAQKATEASQARQRRQVAEMVPNRGQNSTSTSAEMPATALVLAGGSSSSSSGPSDRARKAPVRTRKRTKEADDAFFAVPAVSQQLAIMDAPGADANVSLPTEPGVKRRRKCDKTCGANHEAASQDTGEPNKPQQEQPASDSSSDRRPPATPLRRVGRRSSCGVAPAGSPAEKLQRNTANETCEICADDEIPRGQAVRLRCDHGWYCVPCFRRYVDMRLEAGGADVVCPQCQTEVAERELRELLPADTIDRLLSRSLDRAVSAAENLYACPTPGCSMRVDLADEEDGHEAADGRLECPLCDKESCVRCGAQPFHQGMSCEQYAAKLKRKGKVDEDEEALRKWMQETGTVQCPKCRMGVTKQNLESQTKQYKECHKMACRNCGTRFCFKCLTVLTASYSCGCSIDLHGFIDPVTGKRMDHFRGGKRPPKAKAKPKAHSTEKKEHRRGGRPKR